VRILVTLHNFLPEQTLGAENACMAQMREMIAAGCEVALFYAGNEPPDAVLLEQSGLQRVRLYRVPYLPTKAQVLLSIAKPWVERAYRKALQDFSPDVVLFHHLVRLSLRLPAITRKAGIPAAYFLHDYYWLCPSYSLHAWDEPVCPGGTPWRCAECLYRSRHGKAPSRVVRYLGSLLIRYRDRLVPRNMAAISLFVTPSRNLATEMTLRGVVIPEPVVVRNGRPPPQPGPGDQPRRPVRFGYLGGTSSKKGLETLVSAFRGSLGMQLRIRGFGSVEEMAAFRQRFPDFQGQLELFSTDKQAFFASIDVLVVPSVWLENQPMVVLEAFAAGIPVVASALGGLTEMVRDGEGGRLFPGGDADALRRLVDELSEDPEAVAELRRRIPEWPSWEAETAELLRHLRRLSPGRGNLR